MQNVRENGNCARKQQHIDQSKIRPEPEVTVLIRTLIDSNSHNNADGLPLDVRVEQDGGQAQHKRAQYMANNTKMS
ncbi:MAG: hypothetical protein GY820_02700 [Gammaproteobacteria bacterium]|nr:hypothetical protein [Gammaproteobacteria bacterium]